MKTSWMNLIQFDVEFVIYFEVPRVNLRLKPFLHLWDFNTSHWCWSTTLSKPPLREAPNGNTINLSCHQDHPLCTSSHPPKMKLHTMTWGRRILARKKKRSTSPRFKHRESLPAKIACRDQVWVINYKATTRQRYYCMFRRDVARLTFFPDSTPYHPSLTKAHIHSLPPPGSGP